MIKKNKKLLVAVALNSLAAAYGKNNMQNGQLRHDRLYTGITAQISEGKTDRESYALIEKILKQKTKELEDLYLQSDYILKPEYLSYQIFFSGYYSNISRGKNNGESGSGSADKRVSTADLDIIIPGKEVIYKKAGVFSEIFSNDFNFNIDNNNESPEEYKISGINMSDLSFIPFTQELKIPALFNAANLERVSTGYGQASGIGFMTEGNSILGNSSVAPVAGTTTITVKSGQDVEISGSAFTWNGYNDATRLGYLKNTPTSGVVSAGTYSMYNNTYPHAFLNALAGSYTLSGNWVFVNETTNAYVDNTTNNTVRFISVNHSYGEKDRNTVFNIEPGSVIELYGRNDGHMTVGVEYQSFNALPAVVINEGEIILADGKNLMGASIMLESQRDDTAPRGCLYETTGSSTLNSLCGVLVRKPLEESAFLNKNKIVINSSESIGIDFAKYNYDSTKNPLTIYVESGNIDINGSMNYGIRIPNIFMSYSSGEKYFDETVINGDTGIINVAGEKNTGISIGRRISGSAAVTAYNGLVQSDAADIIGNIRNLDIVLNGSQGTGVLRNANFTDKNQGNIILTDTHIKNLTFGDNAQNSVLIRSDKYGVVLEKNLNVNNTNEINNSTENVVMMANDYNNLGSKKTFVENRAVITIGKNLEQTTGLLSVNGGNLINTGTIIVTSNNSQGLAVLGSSYSGNEASGTNSGNITVSGNKAAGVYNSGSFDMKSGIIDISGNQSIGIYAGENNNKTNLNGGKIISSNGAVSLYTGDNAAVNLSGTSFTVNDGGLLFFTYKDSAANTSTGHINITGTANADINTGGTAFYLKGGTSDITGFINSVFTGNGILNLNMADGNSTLFILDGPGSAINLSQSGEDIITALIPASKVHIQGQNYKIYSAVRGKLIIDQDVNLDDTDDIYNRTEYLSSKVDINSGTVISGSGDGIYAAAQKNYTGTSGRDEVAVRNKGIITLSGKNTIGIVTDFGIISNNGTLISYGDNSIGLLGGNGSLIENTGYIEIGDNSVGIYGTNLLTAEAPGYGNKKIEIINDGSIKTNGTKKGTGIYSDNSDTDVSVSDAVITLGSSSVIDISGTEKSAGVYSNRSVVNGQGRIIAGEKSTGMYLNNSNAVLNDMEIILNGSNSTGIDLAGNSVLSGTVLFDTNGNNNILFNLVSLVPADSFINFDMAGVSGSGNYIGGNVKNAGFYSNGAVLLNDKSIAAAGENSVIMFDENAVITADGNNIAGYADGKYYGNKPFVFSGTGASSDTELVNKGVITLRNGSAGLYAKNGAASLNTGSIEIQGNSVAMFGENIDSLLNTGKIFIGENSKGIYIKEGVLTASVNTGEISGNLDFSAGIYSDYNGGSSSLIKNDGLITMDGMNSAGIYVKGSGVQNIDNTGEITVRDLADTGKLSVGIYNDNPGNTIVNNNRINTGKNSAGIYSKGGNITENGILDIGNGGTGIFTAGGNVTVNGTGIIKTGTDSATGIYASDNAFIKNYSGNIVIGAGSFGFVLESGSGLDNTADLTLNENNILIYGLGAGTIINSGNITVNGSDNVAVYTVEGGTVKNSGDIAVISGKGNIGIYNEGGSIFNTGDISTGDSDIIYSSPKTADSENSKYSIAILGDNSLVKNYGNINLGENAVGIYVVNNLTAAENHGNITSLKNGAVGIYSDSGAGIINYGNISLYGSNVIGIAGRNSAKVVNYGIISVDGENAAGIYATQNTSVENNGTINVSGNGSVGIAAPAEKIINSGIINISDGAGMISLQDNYNIPELINAGIIRVNGEFDASGMKISIKPNLGTLQKSLLSGVDFTLNSVSILADSIKINDMVKILPDFTQGTNANVYKLENVFKAGSISTFENKLSVESSSLTWEAVSEEEDNQNINIYMKKLSYRDFTKGLWFDGLAGALDKNYYGADGNAGIIYDKIDLISSEDDFRHVMASLGGSVYANINQREEDIARAFGQSLDLMSNSVNTTKESVKVNVIAGKGETTEKTAGVESYDYTATGVLALREVERTYKHTFGYSLGYLHTGFEFQDGNDSEEWADTIQLGVHNKYNTAGWKLRNDLTGRVSFHNVDRNIDWQKTGRSEMNGLYETYSITSDNILGKEVKAGKNLTLTPYGAFRAMYITRPSFAETGLEAVRIRGNDAWSAKPRAGVEIESSVSLGRKNEWKLKGKLDFSYEYELLDLNEKEQAKLTAINTDYFDLAKPEREKGALRGKAIIGIEAEDRYGVFLNGEYAAGNSGEKDYRAGITLKAVF